MSQFQGTQPNRPHDPNRAPISYDHYPSIVQKVERSLTEGIVRVLFTDVDATLVLGAGHSANEIAQGQVDMRELISALNNRGFIIIPVTGSHLDSDTKTTNSILNRINEGVLPGIGHHHQDRAYTVDAYVSDGGARAVKSVEGRSYALDASYSRALSALSCEYDALLNQAVAVADEINRQPLSQQDRDLIAQYDKHAGSERMWLQPGTQEGHHKHVNKIAFYFYAANLSERDQVEARFRHLAEPLGLSIVCCEEKDANSSARRHPTVSPLVANDTVPLKYCLDIVPFTKGSAIQYFYDYLSHLTTEMAIERQVSRPSIEIWACGDSGNDQPLMAPPVVSKVVAVGGASDELIRYANRLSDEGRSVYIESDPLRLGPASIAAAVFR